MKLLGRTRTLTVEATVTDAAAPPHSLVVPHYGDWVWLVADAGGGAANLRSVVPLPKDRWLLPGLRVTIDVDPDKLDRVKPFEIDFDQVPTIEQLVAANDAVVADPRAARAAALAAAKAAPTPADAPSGVISRVSSQAWIGTNPAASYVPRPSLDTSSWFEDFDRELAAAPSKPAAPGKTRAVAILTAIRMEMRSIEHNLDGSPAVDRENPGPQRSIRGNDTVLTVSVPGGSPYAVLIRHFKSPRSKPVNLDPTLYPWLPVEVSLTDPNDVQVVWDEVPERMAKVGQLMQEQVDARAAQIQELQQGTGMPAPNLADGTGTEQAAQAARDLADQGGMPPEAAAMLRDAGRQMGRANKHVPAGLQGAIDDAMRLAAQQMSSAAQLAAAPPPSSAPPISADQFHQMAVNSAQMMAASIVATPAAYRQMKIDAVRAGMAQLPPETRDACVAIYREAGVDL